MAERLEKGLDVVLKVHEITFTDLATAFADAPAGPRSHTSGEYRVRRSARLYVRLSMAPTSQTLEPPVISGRFTTSQMI